MQIFRCSAVVFFASALASCTSSFHEMPSYEADGYPVNVSAGVGDATKVSLDGLNLAWDEGDLLAMFADTDDAPVVLTVYDVDAGLSQAKFKGAVDALQQPSFCYFAYPSDVKDFSSDGSVIFDYSSQDGSHKPFLCGYSAYDPDEMYVDLVHVGSVLRISNNIKGLTSITVRGNSSERFSKIVCDARSGDTEIADDASGEIVLTSSSGFGSKVFIAMPPATFAKGFTLICENSEGARTYKSYSSDGLSESGYDFTSHRGYIYDMTLDESPVVIDDISCVPKHTFDSDGYLTGTEVSLTLGRSGVSDKIAEWSAVLTDSEGRTVRSYDSSDRPYNSVMTDSDDWPYLNPGYYTLSVTCSVQGDVYTAEQTINIPSPDLLDVHASTTYSVYLASGAEAANNTGHGSDAIYDVKAEIKVAPELFSHPKYSAATINYSAAGISTGNISVSSSGVHDPSFGDIAAARNEHKVIAELSFGGIVYSDEITVHVTGLPYDYNFVNGSLDQYRSDGWTLNGSLRVSACGLSNHVSTLVLYYYRAVASSGYVVSPEYHLPTALNVQASVIRDHYSSINGNRELYVGPVSNTAASNISAVKYDDSSSMAVSGKIIGQNVWSSSFSLSADTPYISIDCEDNRISTLAASYYFIREVHFRYAQ